MMPDAQTSIGCLTNCGRIAENRGLCMRCYLRLRQSVISGKTTWRQLEESGQCLPAKKRAWNAR